MKKIKLLACLVVFIGTLVGCASKSVKQDFSLDTDKNSGLIVISIDHPLDAPGGVSTFFYINGGPTDKNGFIMQTGGRDFQDSYGQLLVFSLPAGKHAVTSWQADAGTGKFLHPRPAPKPLTFEVKAGEVKYLGNLTSTFSSGRNLFGMPVLAGAVQEVKDRRDRDIPIFESRYPQFRGKVIYDLMPLGKWN